MRLKDLREERKLSQLEVAKAIGGSQSNLAKWEKGTISPSADFIIKLADFFQVSADYLLGRADDFGYVNVQSSAPALTTQEQNLLKDFRKLVPEMQSYIEGIVHSLAVAG